MDAIEKLKRDARKALQEAIFDGFIQPPEHCPRCGEHTVVNGHHWDYFKPLDVHWLCAWCHFCEHQRQLGLPVPTQRRSPVPACSAPRGRKPAKRPRGRPTDASRYLRERPLPRRRSYGEFAGQPVVRRNGSPAIKTPDGFVYVRTLIADEVVRAYPGPDPRYGVVKYIDGNEWNWARNNVEVDLYEWRRPHGIVHAVGVVTQTGFTATLPKERHRGLRTITKPPKAKLKPRPRSR